MLHILLSLLLLLLLLSTTLAVSVPFPTLPEPVLAPSSSSAAQIRPNTNIHTDPRPKTPISAIHAQKHPNAKRDLYYVRLKLPAGAHIIWMTGSVFAMPLPWNTFAWPGISAQDKVILFQPVLNHDQTGTCHWSSQVFDPEHVPGNGMVKSTSLPCATYETLGFTMWHAKERGTWRLSTASGKVKDNPLYTDWHAFHMNEVFFALEVFNGPLQDEIGITFKDIAFTVRGTDDLRFCHVNNFEIIDIEAQLGQVTAFRSHYGIVCKIDSISMSTIKTKPSSSSP